MSAGESPFTKARLKAVQLWGSNSPRTRSIARLQRAWTSAASLESEVGPASCTGSAASSDSCRCASLPPAPLTPSAAERSRSLLRVIANNQPRKVSPLPVVSESVNRAGHRGENLLPHVSRVCRLQCGPETPSVNQRAVKFYQFMPRRLVARPHALQQAQRGATHSLTFINGPICHELSFRRVFFPPHWRGGTLGAWNRRKFSLILVPRAPDCHEKRVG